MRPLSMPTALTQSPENRKTCGPDSAGPSLPHPSRKFLRWLILTMPGPPILGLPKTGPPWPKTVTTRPAPGRAAADAAPSPVASARPSVAIPAANRRAGRTSGRRQELTSEKGRISLKQLSSLKDSPGPRWAPKVVKSGQSSTPVNSVAQLALEHCEVGGR